MKNYLDLLNHVLDCGYEHPARTKANRITSVGHTLRFNLQDGLPVVTTRKVYLRAIIRELQWFISGSIDATQLEGQNVNIWKHWTLTEDDVKNFVTKWFPKDPTTQDRFYELIVNNQRLVGTIGPMYGFFWRNSPLKATHRLWPTISFKDIPSDKLDLYRMQYEEILYFAKMEESTKDKTPPTFEQFAVNLYHDSIDQLNNVFLALRDNPYSSRLIVNSWIPEAIPFEQLSPEENIILGKGALAPCHMTFQFFVRPPSSDGDKPTLSMLLYMRSNDLPVGAPYNISQYSLLTMMIAHLLNYNAGELIYVMGDAHVYSDQVEGAKEQLTREPLKLPRVKFASSFTDLFNFDPDSDIEIVDYKSHPAINYPVAI